MPGRNTVRRSKNRSVHPELPLDPDVLLSTGKLQIHQTAVFQTTVFAGGCLGALARYGVIRAFPAHSLSWPASTFLVNMTGAFILGILLEALSRRGSDTGLRRLLRLWLGTGFMGAYTTYSTLAVDTDLLLKNGEVTIAVFYTAASLIGGVTLGALGIWVGSLNSKHAGGTR